LKKAFTLLELLIVVLIIGVVYSMAISKFQQVGKSDATNVTLANLKEYMQQFSHKKSVRFLCLDDCSSCDIFVDDIKQEELKGVFDKFIDNSIKIYRYDFLLGALEQESESFFNVENTEERVCFSYKINNKNIGEQLLVEYKDRVYDYTSYFEKTPIYDSLEDFREEKEKLAQEILR
jgi:prepilin-type N-terminal cleavage/methylation domain-containing protein